MAAIKVIKAIGADGNPVYALPDTGMTGEEITVNLPSGWKVDPLATWFPWFPLVDSDGNHHEISEVVNG